MLNLSLPVKRGRPSPYRPPHERLYLQFGPARLYFPQAPGKREVQAALHSDNVPFLCPKSARIRSPVSDNRGIGGMRRPQGVALHLNAVFQPARSRPKAGFVLNLLETVPCRTVPPPYSLIRLPPTLITSPEPDVCASNRSEISLTAYTMLRQRCCR